MHAVADKVLWGSPQFKEPPSPHGRGLAERQHLTERQRQRGVWRGHHFHLTNPLLQLPFVWALVLLFCTPLRAQNLPNSNAPKTATHTATKTIAATDPYQVLSQIGHALHIVESEYYTPPDQAKMVDGAIRGMVSGLDPHSAYFDRQDLSIFEGSTSGKFGGIGVEVEFVDGKIIVINPIEGSPADRAGILPGDQIVAIDNQPLLDVAPHEIVGLMRGPLGSILHLTIKHAKTQHTTEVKLTREQIAVASVRAKLLLRGVGYFRIKAFQEGTHREFLDELAKMRDEAGELSGMILDLRNNPGGFVREAAAIADEFLTHGVLFSTRHRGQILRVDRARSGGAYTTGPLVVLINEYSASASELVAGALRDQQRALILGAQSFGKGSVQTLLLLSHGGALKLTTALYYTPSGQTTQALGVTPHRLIDPGYEESSSGFTLREEDLKGHLNATGLENHAKSTAQRSRGIPPTNESLHLGVARIVPSDPSQSADKALKAAYAAVLGESPLP